MKHSGILLDWKSRKCVLATMHGKESVISPVLRQKLGIEMFVPPGFNTDRFGTFTRDIPRAGNQLEAARKKALAAMAETDSDLGVASEGSFGAHPSIPFLASNLEIVVLIDKKHCLEVVGHYHNSALQVRAATVKSSKEALKAALTWGFPQQGVILRQSERSSRQIFKEIRTKEELVETSERLLSSWFTSSIYLETDMRAHRCPARMVAIEAATISLTNNCQSLCPECGAPGFVITQVVPGLPCSTCLLPTEQVKESRYICQKCHFTKSEPAAGSASADPCTCASCNP